MYVPHMHVPVEILANTQKYIRYDLKLHMDMPLFFIYAVFKIYSPFNFLYGYETWYLTLREEHRFRALENRVPKRIFGPKWRKWWEVVEDCIMRSLVYTSPNIIRVIKSKRMSWVERVARMEEMRYSYKILVGRLEGRDHLEDVAVGGWIILERILGK